MTHGYAQLNIIIPNTSETKNLIVRANTPAEAQHLAGEYARDPNYKGAQVKVVRHF